MEGVLFLSRPEGADAPVLAEVVEPPTAQTFVFTKSHYENNQGRVSFTIDNIDPAWLPLQETTGARGASAAADAASSFITETVYRQELPSEYVIEYVPIDPAPSITLTNLRTMIAWVDGGDGIASYEDCVLSVISYKQFFRDWEAFYQRTWKTQQAESQVASGAGERTTVHTYGNSRDPGYSEVWLTGPDMDLFRAEIVDDDTDPSNGYTDTIMTARPCLPECTISPTIVAFTNT